MSTLRTRLLAAVAVALAAALGATLYAVLQQDDEKSAVIPAATGADAGEFRYPASWDEEPRTPADETAGLLLKLERPDAEASFLIRRAAGRLEPGFSLDALASQTEAALKAEIENLKLLENRRYRDGSLDVVEISYLQDRSPENFRVVLLVIPTEEQTFYVTSRAAENGFQKVEKDVREMNRDFIRYVRSTTSG